MPLDVRITNHGRRVPVVAFFGTKGGVGKTTIARRFAELVTLAESAPNVLLVDGDVHHRGMTIEMTAQTPATCKTVHDYIASQNTSDVEAADMSGLVKGARPGSGRLFFVPASSPESEQVFAKSAAIGAERMLDILQKVVASAVEQYDCRCVVIDCGPIIDPYTAGAAMLADRAFIIGQNEPISFAALKTYPRQMQDFYPTFSTAKMKIIINKVRGWERLEQRKLTEDIFAAIPFTMEIVDASEGIASANDMKMMLFEDQIAQILEKVFQGDHPELIAPRQSLLPREWESLIEKADQLERAPAIRRLGTLRLLLPVGLLAMLVGGFLFYTSSGARHRAEVTAERDRLVEALTTAVGAAGDDIRATAALTTALEAARAVEPSQPESLAQARDAARAAGLPDLPAAPRLDATAENTGIGILLGGLVVAGLGFSCARSRKNYLSALQGVRRGGAKWLMGELQTKRTARKTFDKLLAMSR